MIELYAMKAWYDNRLGMVTLEDDVLGVVASIKEMYGGRVTVSLDPDTGFYHLVEHCEDQTDRLIFSTREFDARVLERLMMGDSTGRLYIDPYDAAERAQDEAQKAIDDAYRERLNEEGERLAHALYKDGILPYHPTRVAFPEVPDADD